MDPASASSSASPTGYEEPSLSVDNGQWSLPTDEKNILWNSDTSVSSKRVFDFATIEFSQPGVILAKSEFIKRDIQDNQTLTLFDLNQNHDDKAILEQPNKCEPLVSTEEEAASQSSSPLGEAVNNLAPCVVCGDKSSGKHYGQLTCEGCKSFFKRSVRRNLTYTCRGSRDCAIDPQHRNQCQYCRLRKCLKSGMRREAVQRGRVNHAPPLEYPYHMQQVLPSVETSRLNACYMSNFMSVLLRAEPYPMNHMQTASTIIAAHLDGLSEMTARLFFSAIEWAKNLQFFTELTLLDQITLLRSCWAELFLINTTQCYPPPYIGSFVAAVNSPNSDTRFNGPCNPEIVRQIQDQMDKLAALRMDAAEYCCMKALVLFSPDVPGLQDPLTVQNIQEKTQLSLDEYDKIQYNNQPIRCSRLLLRLPALKMISSSAIEGLFFARLVGKTPIDNMIRDILVGNSFCWGIATDHNNPSHM